MVISVYKTPQISAYTRIVVTGHAQVPIQGHIVAVDDLKELLEPPPVEGRHRSGRRSEFRDFPFDEIQAIVAPVRVPTHRQQATALAIEDEQQAVKEIEAVFRCIEGG